MIRAVTPEEFIDWKQHPVTESFFKALNNKREELKENIVCSLYENEEFVKGKIMFIKEMQEMTYEEFMEILADGKH